MMKQCLLTLGVIVLATATAYSQGGISLGPQIGFYKSRDADNSKIMGGAAMRFNFFPGLGLEGSVNYREEDYNGGHLSVKSYPVMVTGLIYVVPVIYGAIGAGWYNSSIDYNYPPGYNGGPGSISSETKQDFGWHFGGGAELPVGSSAKIVGDIRYVFLDYNFKSIPGVNGLNSDFYVVTAGLLFNL